jgi:predicted  nucleic acid-binding Zn-ribbon protein
MAREHETSTVIDTEFDIIEELTGALDEIEKALNNQEDLLEKTAYIRFLIEELDDSLSGQYEALRRRRFITKKSD